MSSGGTTILRCATKPIASIVAALLAVSAASTWAVTEVQNARPAPSDARIAEAWKALRDVDCARCHGKDYDGLAAPSIIEYARTQSRESFVRMVLDGDLARGMPGYRSNPRIIESIDDTYRYFLGRANGSIGPGPPIPAPPPRSQVPADQ